MQRPYQFIAFKLVGDVYCVRLQKPRVEDHQMDDLGAELARLIDEENCRKMVLNLGPEEPECLISIFLAKLINLHRRLEAMNGALTLAQASDYTRNIFRIAGIEKFFDFYPDEQSALQALTAP
jgi:anti-sigma B factor antagonist